ncbi:MAG TPA: protein kinase [Ktedonobacteraceae bacterium]|nr:protein kinase [Ktedonobacteraceae bacterium]
MLYFHLTSLYVILWLCPFARKALSLIGCNNADILSPQDVAHFISQAADALQHAHDHQLIHRDVKPSNFLIHSRARDPGHPDLLLADFGIAKFAAATNTTTTTLASPTGQANSTATTQVNATATFIAQNPNPYPPQTGTLLFYGPLSDNSSGYGWGEGTDSTGGCQFTNRVLSPCM